jgi:hypothetical protein
MMDFSPPTKKTHNATASLTAQKCRTSQTLNLKPAVLRRGESKSQPPWWIGVGGPKKKSNKQKKKGELNPKHTP